ncbi:hypothetical protein F971_01989 [Acinetobacter vivianii]|uniref:Tape measure protein N-terminal domain-containing protein n=1 Tax=Acinetobacter vivianii TaxID=1776742 RepID=N8W9X6_9GAMM|nr:tape measure protein [Acinetobacter vivianii]ENU92102.1 hypothetical protein F971_01989 [Acinetobacter vivianii]
MTQTARLEVVIDSQNAERRAQMLGNELINIEQRGDYAGKAMDNLSVSIRKLTGMMAGLITVNQAIARADGYTQNAARIRNATQSAEEYKLVQDRLFQSTKSTFRALSEAQEVYLGLAGGMKALGHQTKDTLDVSDSLSFSFVANAARADQAQSAIDALNKSMAKGKIDANAWISIVSAADNIISDMAKTTGMAEAEIRKLGAEGKISLEDLIKTLKLTKDSNKELADAMENSLADGLTTLSNAVTKFIGELNMSTGATNTAAAGLGVLADNIDVVTNVAMIGGAYWLATYIPTVVKTGVAIGGKVKVLGMQTTAQYAAIQAERAAAAQELLSAQAKLTNLQATKAQLIEELKLELRRSKSQISTQGAINSEIRMGLLRRQQAAINTELTATENALASAKARTAAAGAASMTSGRALLGFMTGPAGLGMTVAGLAASYLLLSNNTKVSTEALEDQKKTVSELVQEYKSLTLEKLISQQGDLNKKIKNTKDEVSTALMSLERLTKIRKNSTQDEINRSVQLKKAIADLRKQTNDGIVAAGETLSKLSGMGFNEKEIAKIEKYATQLESGSKGLKEFKRQQALLSQQTGMYGDKLDENQQKINEQQALINGLSGDYKKLGTEVRREADTLIEQAVVYGLTKEQLVKLQEAREMYDKGTILSTQLSSVLNENLNIPKETLDSFGKLAIRTDEVKVKLDNANASLGKANDENAKLVQKTQGVQSFYQAHIQGAINASNELAGLNAQLQDLHNDRLFDAAFVEDMMKKGFSESHARDLLKSYKDAVKLGLDNIDAETVTMLKRTWALEDSIKSKTDERTESIRKQNKEIERQAVLLAGNDEKARNMLRVYQAFRNAGFSDKAARVMTSQVGRENDFSAKHMFGAHKDENNGFTNVGFFSWQKDRADKLLPYLKSEGQTSKDGSIKETQGALDAMARFTKHELNTNPSYRKTRDALNNSNLSYREMEQASGTNYVRWDRAGNKLGKAKAAKHLEKQDAYYEKLSGLLGSKPEIVLDVLADTSKLDDTFTNAVAKTLDEIASLQDTYSSEAVLRNKQREEEINQATILGQKQLIPKIKERFDAQEQLAQKQFDFETNGYKWTEEKKLEYTHETNLLRLVAEGKLSEEQRKIATSSFKMQLQQEQALLELAKEQRLFQARQALMTETDLIRERYRLEREEILKTSGIEDDEKKQRIKYSEMSQQKELNDRLKNSTIEMARINAEMKGVEALFEINQTKATRYQANEKLYDSETAVIDLNEGNELEELQRQFDEKLLSQQQFEDQKTAIIQSALEQRKAAYNEFKENERDIDAAAGQAQLDFYMGQTQATLGAFQGMFGAILGEQSSAYRTMYAVNQAFALAKAGMNLWESASDAYAKEPGTVYQKAGAALKATIDQGTMIAMIQAATPKGFSDGGYTGHGGKYDEAGIVHKGEVVWSQEDIQRWGGVSVVEAMRKNSPKGYSSGGLVSNYDTRQAVQRESRQLDSIQQTRTLNLIAPKVTIINQTTKEFDASTEWDGNELTVKLEEFKKQNEVQTKNLIAQSWRDAERQGGALDRVKRGK